MREGWEYKKFENCIVKSPKLKQVKKEAYNNGSQYPIISQEEKFISGYCDDESIVCHIDRPIVVFGDHTRVLKYIDFDFVVGADGVKVIIPIKSIDSKFLLYFLQWYNIPNLGYSRHYKLLKDVMVPIPNCTTQQTIISELDKLNELIRIKKEQLKDYDALAQSIFYEMFGDPVVNEKGWEVKTFGECFSIGAGGTPSTKVKEYWDNGTIPWIGSNMCQNCIITETDGKFITEEGLTHSSTKLLAPGTVLVALVGATIGKVGLLRIETCTNQNVAFIKVQETETFTSEFVYYHLMGLYGEFMKIGQGNFKMANQGFIKLLPISLPPLPLQHSFAQKIEQIEQQKATIQKTITDLETLLAARMQYWFD
ncbi:restriction endonuclease subunit S [Prevotella melaninogenica]|uniref:restriction endonuclease subunit S n=1 Tax=Prevotella melaninogenica TaxID=28132 RepID=UPI001D15BBA6|nr:restriction endonuclease subunit S [Prevotella melaninogenica]UEA99149.1 restriction endonuclease subunit S [Prevotella melaninogenica]